MLLQKSRELRKWIKLKMTSLNCLAKEGIVAGRCCQKLEILATRLKGAFTHTKMNIHNITYHIHILSACQQQTVYQRRGSIFSRDNNWQRVWKICSLLCVGPELIWDRGYILTKLRSSLPQGLITTFILKHQGGGGTRSLISMLTAPFVH